MSYGVYASLDTGESTDLIGDTFATDVYLNSGLSRLDDSTAEFARENLGGIVVPPEAQRSLDRLRTALLWCRDDAVIRFV